MMGDNMTRDEFKKLVQEHPIYLDGATDRIC